MKEKFADGKNLERLSIPPKLSLREKIVAMMEGRAQARAEKQVLEKRGYRVQLETWRDYTEQWFNEELMCFYENGMTPETLLPAFEVKGFSEQEIVSRVSLAEMSDEVKQELGKQILAQGNFGMLWWAMGDWLEKQKRFKLGQREMNCAAYVGFGGRLIEQLLPETEVKTIYGLGRTLAHWQDETAIGKMTDHFWLEIEGKVYDNSGVHVNDYDHLVALAEVTGLGTEKVGLRMLERMHLVEPQERVRDWRAVMLERDGKN
jgi:hypothetical protein